MEDQNYVKTSVNFYKENEQRINKIRKAVFSKNGAMVFSAYMAIISMYNGFRSADIDPTLKRSADSYVDIKQKGFPSTTITLSSDDITYMSEGHRTFTVRREAFNREKVKYLSTRSAYNEWESVIEDTVEAVRDENNGFALLPFGGWANDGDELIQVADRYNLRILPIDMASSATENGENRQEKANSRPMLVIERDGLTQEFNATIYINQQWDERLNTQVLTRFLEKLADQEGSNESPEGRYNIERTSNNDFQISPP